MSDPAGDGVRAAIDRAAELDEYDYLAARLDIAKSIKIPAAELDRQVKKIREPGKNGKSNGHANGHIETPVPSHEPLADDERSPEYSEDNLALEFAGEFDGKLRHVAAWGKWLEWNGSVWRPDDTTHVFDLTRMVCRRSSIQAEQEGKASLSRALTSAKCVAAVEKMARSDRRVACPIEWWDKDPWIINTPLGVVDLKTGILRPSNSEFFVSKITACSPEFEPPERWLAFLETVTAGDTAMQDYLQRMAGYALTGSVREHAMFFAYGTGGNGKGVFTNTISSIMGDYHVVSDMETFTASIGNRHPTELAKLRGARLVTSQETEEGKRWAESRIKALTGGDRITAHFMRQDFFEYDPQFKLLIVGNHKPGLRSVDAAIRRRFNLLPFDVRISEPDKNLSETLRGEWPRIFGWMIEGCLQWQKIALNPPPAVVDATDEYLSSEDAVTTWIDDCCRVGGYEQDFTEQLFASWKAWATRNEELVGSNKRFSQALIDRGHTAGKKSGKRCFTGLSLLPIDAQDTDLPYHMR